MLNKNKKSYIRYVIIGIFAFICDSSVLYIAYSFFNLSFFLSFSLGFIAGTSISFVFVGYIYQLKTKKRINIKNIFLFIIIHIVGFFLVNYVLTVFFMYIGFFYLIAKMFSVGIIFSFNYFLKKKILFNIFS